MKFLQRFATVLIPIMMSVFLVISAEEDALSDQDIHSQYTERTSVQYRDQCETKLHPVQASGCSFYSALDGDGNLKMVIKTPAQGIWEGSHGQFNTDFPDQFSITIPKNQVSSSGPYLQNFRQYAVDSNHSDPCHRSISQELKYDITYKQLKWTYTTFSGCSHDNYSAELILEIQPDLTVTQILEHGTRAGMPMSCHGTSYGFENTFQCQFQ